MRKIVIISILCFLGILQLNAQDKTKKDAPDEQITVNKQYDENGNLIQFDSTYVHQWSADSTFNFPFDENFAFGGNMEDFLQQFATDSTLAHFGFSFGDFMNPLHPNTSDSIFLKKFHMNNDSLLNYHFNFQDMYPLGFEFPDIQAFEKQLQEELNNQGYVHPELKSKKQQEEWEKLMEKQQKEKEELIKKWEKGK